MPIENYKLQIVNYRLQDQLNQLGQKKIPFFFIIDFDVKNFYLAPLNKLDAHIFFSIDGFSNVISNDSTKNGLYYSFDLKKKRLVSENIHWLSIRLSEK